MNKEELINEKYEFDPAYICEDLGHFDTLAIEFYKDWLRDNYKDAYHWARMNLSDEEIIKLTKELDHETNN